MGGPHIKDLIRLYAALRALEGQFRLVRNMLHTKTFVSYISDLLKSLSWGLTIDLRFQTKNKTP